MAFPHHSGKKRGLSAHTQLEGHLSSWELLPGLFCVSAVCAELVRLCALAIHSLIMIMMMMIILFPHGKKVSKKKLIKK